MPIHRRAEMVVFDAKIDGMEMTPAAFRVYIHLLVSTHRREDGENGDHCFTAASRSPDQREAMAEAALYELRDNGLLTYEDGIWGLI